MSYHQYVEDSHVCPHAKSPIALATEPAYHHVIRVGVGVAQNKNLVGWLHPDIANMEDNIGDISMRDLEGETLLAVAYNMLNDVFFVMLVGGNPQGWTSINVVLPGGANFSCPWDDASQSFVWPMGGMPKDFVLTGVTVTVQLTPVV